MKINKDGLELIKHFEGCYLSPYYCPAGVLTQGYGHTGKDVKKGVNITQAQADKWLAEDMAEFEDAVTRLVKADLNENQFSALVSFSFNVGSGALARSTLLRCIHAGDFKEAGRQFLRWDKAKGKRLKGLTRRREAEKKLFEKPATVEDITEVVKRLKTRIDDIEERLNNAEVRI